MMWARLEDCDGRAGQTSVAATKQKPNAISAVAAEYRPSRHSPCPGEGVGWHDSPPGL